MIILVIYADILIVLNLIVNYFLLLFTSKILHKNPKIVRVFSGAFLGAISSLYIFLPQVSVFAELSFKIALCSVISLIVFGVKSVKQYIKSTGMLFVVTCGYAGIMITVWRFFRPLGMTINNSIVYFNISPIVLVVITVCAYILFSILLFIV